MNVNFEKNAYFHAVLGSGSADRDEKIFNFARNHPQFSYGDVSFSKFKKIYPKESSSIGRKVIALPAAVWSGVVKSTYHIAKAIFMGIIAALSDNGKYFKAHCFYVARDFQESFGWLASLFDHQYGEYLIQGSGFNKSCYDCWLNNKPTTNTQPPSKPPLYSKGPVSTNRPEFPLKNTFQTPTSSTTSKTAVQKENLPRTSSCSEIDFDNELNKIDSLTPYAERSESYADLAEKCIASGFLDNALKTVDKIWDAEIKKKLQLKIIDAYLKRGEYNHGREQALKIINATCYVHTKEAFLAKIAESYYAEQQFEEALKTINLLWSDTTTKENFLIKIADAYFKSGGREGRKAALEVISKIYSDIPAREKFLIKIADACLKIGAALGEASSSSTYREEALEVISKIYSDIQAKENFLIKIAENYLKSGGSGGRKAAVTVISKIYSDIKAKEAFLGKVAEFYYKEQKLEDALKTINGLYSDTKTKETFIIKVAHAYLQRGEKEKVVPTIKSLPYNGEIYFLLTLLAQSYFSANDQANVVESIEIIAKGLLSTKMIQSGMSATYTAIMNSSSLQGKTKNFFNTLARNCLVQAKEHFTNNNISAILREIARQSTDFSTIATFVNLGLFSPNWGYSAPQSGQSTYASYFGTNPKNWGYSARQDAHSDYRSYFGTNWRYSAPQGGQSTYRFSREAPNASSGWGDSVPENKPKTKSDYLSLLGLPSTATEKEMISKYKKLALAFHPDRIHQNENETDEAFKKRKQAAEEKFKEIGDAHDELIKLYEL